MIIRAVRDWLATDVALRLDVGERIYRDRVPQGEPRPYVVLRRIATNREYDLANQVPAAATLVQVDLFVDRPHHVDSLGEHIRDRMSGYRGTMGEHFVMDCTIERDDDSALPPGDGSDAWVYQRSIDFLINHDEDVPNHA